MFSARGVALKVTTVSVQLRLLHNSVYISARLKLPGTNSTCISNAFSIAPKLGFSVHAFTIASRALQFEKLNHMYTILVSCIRGNERHLASSDRFICYWVDGIAVLKNVAGCATSSREGVSKCISFAATEISVILYFSILLHIFN
jgi:hypothetical protein